MNAPRVIPSTRKPASAAAGSDEEALDRIVHLLHVERARERAVREGVAAGEPVQLRGVTSLDRVDRDQRGEHLAALDRGNLPEVGGGADVLERRADVDRAGRATCREARDRALGRLAAELLHERGESVDVLVLVLLDRLEE